MSHAVVTVILPPGTDPNSDLEEAISAAMAPYDENRNVPHRDVMDGPDLEFMRETYENNDALAFSKSNLRWVENLVPLIPGWNGGTNAQAVTTIDGVRTIEYDSMYNPDSKWDWWVIGGRWDGFFIGKDGSPCNVIRVGDIDWDENDDGGPLYSFALLDSRLDPPDSWKENGAMGWFGVKIGGDDTVDWPERWRAYVKSLPPDTVLVAVDYHI